MELSWSTFVLEIINFLVLVWILKRFLYKPVLDIIARRRESIEDRLAASRRMSEEAATLKSEYENRLSEWEQERQQLRDTLAQEIDTERARQMEELDADLTQEREKAQVAESRQRREAEREIEHRALQQGAQFASRFLTQTAGPELEARLMELLLDGLANLSDDQVAALRTQLGEAPEVIRVASAFTLPAECKQQLEEALAEVSGLDVPVVYEQDSGLVAGLRIVIGAWVLHTNLMDELKGFAEFTHAAR